VAARHHGAGDQLLSGWILFLSPGQENHFEGGSGARVLSYWFLVISRAGTKILLSQD
jgi:hypothetical protein